MHKTLHALTLMCCLLIAGRTTLADEPGARGVLARLLGDRAGDVQLRQIPPDNGLDVYETEAADGKVIVAGSSGVAMCRGAYDYLRDKCQVSIAWSGRHVDLPAKFPDQARTRVVCPNRFVQYYNVCTFGYTTAFWSWEQWQRELDWMALHGINMPLAHVAAEAIWQRVWLDEGITQRELDEYFTGPAFLPWHRMGNINHHDGPLPQSWQTKTVALQKQIMQRMHELDMQPIAPAFAGYVPPAFRRVHPDAKLIELAQWGGFEKHCATFILDPTSPLFAQTGKKFIAAWEKEYGPAKYFLADTFNEMQVPVPDDRQERMKRLAQYGQAVYDSVIAGRSDAVWVMQGWLFFNNRKFWDRESVQAFLSKVPNDRMIILDLANDFREMWKEHDAFYGKQWIYSVIHNMGGKSAVGGSMQFFADDAAAAMQSPKHGKLVGYGMAPEGVENNEVIYELMCDAAWSRERIDLDAWTRRYCLARYGECPPEMQQAWKRLRHSCYSKNVHDTRPGYQYRPTVDPKWTDVPDDSPEFRDAVSMLLSCSDRLRDSELYRVDAVELTAQLAGSRIDALLKQAMAAHRAGDAKSRDAAAKEALALMDELDDLLASHPLNRLDRWVKMARGWADTPAEADYYEADAKRQITTWGGPDLSEYASRVWSGLVRGYYRGRWEQFLKHLAAPDPAFDLKVWEEKWITTPGASAPARKMDDPIAAAKRLFEKCENR